MPYVTTSDGVRLFYEERGSGTPIVFVHEFADDYRGWAPQVAAMARRYRTIAYNARGYPPSEVPEDVRRYSQQRAADDLRDVIDGLGLERAHLCGISMGGYAALHFTIQHPERVRSLVLAGTGYGSTAAERAKFQADVETTARRMLSEGMRSVASWYSRGPTRVQFETKDPDGFRAFVARLAEHSDLGSANTFLGVQRERPSVFELKEHLAALDVPVLIIVGDEDDPCLEPALFLKRTIPRAGLVMLPKSGHTINLEEPERFNAAVLDFFATVDAGRWERRDPRSQTGSAILPADAT
ncbi:MAG: alpha/beta hydrolase [Chloroflexota bacterium]|nr:alpha/beta hydrolase [Dehalococcoidia bacterium]MDW8252418.1 alpha/beta hydrolase [Chloroflexota bacterium]